MEEERARRVLEWLAEFMEWVYGDPVNRLKDLQEEVERHRDIIIEAFKTACEPELRDYIDSVVMLIGSGRGEGEGGSKESG